MCGSERLLPHPRALAFLGDAVYEIRLRELAVQEGMSRSEELHRFTTARARGTFQCALLQALDPLLTEGERDIVRAARNLPVSAGRRAEQAVYRQATALEALLGALHLGDSARLETIWQVMAPWIRAGSVPETAALPGAGSELPDAH